MRKGHANCIVSNYIINIIESPNVLITIILEVWLSDCALTLIIYWEIMEKSCIKLRRTVISHVHSFRSPVYYFRIHSARGNAFLSRSGHGGLRTRTVSNSPRPRCLFVYRCAVVQRSGLFPSSTLSYFLTPGARWKRKFSLLSAGLWTRLLLRQQHHRRPRKRLRAHWRSWFVEICLKLAWILAKVRL